METVQTIYALGGSAFIALLIGSVLTTGARVLFYLRQGKPRPRLLTRDVLVKGQLLLAFTPIIIVRFLDPDTRAALNLTSNVPWALWTTAFGVSALAVYLYFEIFVIERAK